MATALLPRPRRVRYGGRCLCIGWVLALLCHLALAAQGMLEAVAPETGATLRFDIGRLPMRQALEQYLRTSGHSLLYDDAITAGKQAGPLRGEFTPEAALRTLLAGSGIVASSTAPAAWVLLDGRAAAAATAGTGAGMPAAAESGAQASGATAYYAVLQVRIGQALCGDPVTMPGSYRLALRLWIGADQAIERVLLHPSGNAVRDQRVQRRLQGLQMPVPVPPGMVQPMTLVILPRAPALSGDCAAARLAPAGRVEAA
ncbi:hypothetical protein BKK81_32395 [Cupriavidus sp. USMAHM13]|nr:hypothetical protein BKK81_32395 [Cupriavidus sp. USMAHM13]